MSRKRRGNRSRLTTECHELQVKGVAERSRRLRRIAFSEVAADGSSAYAEGVGNTRQSSDGRNENESFNRDHSQKRVLCGRLTPGYAVSKSDRSEAPLIFEPLDSGDKLI